MTLRKQVEKAGADTVHEFKASQTFINSCAKYYGTGFEDFLKQVVSVFPELDLSGISVDDPIPTTSTRDTIVDEDDDFTELDPPFKDDDVILAHPTTNPLVSTSNPSIKLLDVESPLAQGKDDRIPNDAPVA